MKPDEKPFSHASAPFDPQQISAALLAWYGESGRDLPWRQTRDPYHIWLSEIMLQQTTVAAVIGYYRRFLENFPTVGHLAAAPQETVIDLWAGLGYYARARNLHAAAQRVVEDFGGVFPADLAELMTLPGIGRSTAGAISSLAFERRAPILDGNVRRVLCRLFAWQEAPRSSRAEKQLWSWADLLTPEQQVHDYTQAIMDLGATVCTPRSPACGSCPLSSFCQARRQGMEQDLPLKQVRRTVPVRTEAALLLCREGHYFVRRRPASGLLGGLWEFPTISVPEGAQPAQQAARLLRDQGASGRLQGLGRIEHLYSHFRLELHLFHANLAGPLLVNEEAGDWCPADELETLALHGAHKKGLTLLGG
ncbi:MAG: A/G-specific adenine glycosylase [Desulfuromonadales bacterium]|nr:A/G-specific adenine glycosylase [Desulfuromonadales bacterium]